MCVVVLQNCMDAVENETPSCSESSVICDDDGTEEVSTEVEEAIDVKKSRKYIINSLDSPSQGMLHGHCTNRVVSVALRAIENSQMPRHVISDAHE